MSKVWNPGAKPETVREFLRDWCERFDHLWSVPEDLFGAYEIYCRFVKKKDLTLGEFVYEMEQLGFQPQERHGQQVWRGVGLRYMQDAVVRRGFSERKLED